ncbi:kinase-like domain-containing protein [Cokeromyces recurvatus]|uniref:kinase-like domain-containing protein n=1 Tax=Cokeromyces recurvatus TaxID=90255 RepID=UPI00221EAB5B|nr:kinase-like domain-containing protein [Cokeromyces recurvatus]KAI7897952.1 kinase-like domain-containing protein [Cokeromyces recurvatus]
MVHWFNSPLQFHRRWKETKNEKQYIGNGRYRLLHEIGQGTSSIVHLAIDLKTKQKYAIKEISKSRLARQYQSNLFYQNKKRDSMSYSKEMIVSNTDYSKKRKLNNTIQQQIITKQMTLVVKEATILKQLSKHINIIDFIEMIQDSEYEDSIFIVTEFVEKGVVMDIIPHSSTKPYSEIQCYLIFKQLVAAVDHLHQNQIIHGDIKPQNLILSKDNSLRLIDFGTATFIINKATHYDYKMSGTPAFMAPELLKKTSKEGSEPSSPTCIDIWSMGITLYCLVYGHLPFERTHLLDLYFDIQNKS